MFRKIFCNISLIFILILLVACNASPSTLVGSSPVDTEPAPTLSATNEAQTGEQDTTAPSTDNDTAQDDGGDLPQDEPVPNSGIDIDTLWEDLAGVWYDPETEYLDFFVIDFDSANQPVVYTVYGFDKEDDAVATGISEIENNKYIVDLETPDGAWEWIFDHNNDGELIVADTGSNYAYHYTFLSASLEEAYNLYGAYGNSSGENTNGETGGSEEVSITDAEEILREHLQSGVPYPISIEYIGDYTYVNKDDCYNFVVTYQIGTETIRLGRYAVPKNQSDGIEFLPSDW